MALPTAVSFLVSTTFCVITFAGMQLFKATLAGSEMMTIVGGLVGSVLFILLLTGVSNAETLVFGRGFQTKLPEVAVCLLMAAIASGLVHRVSFTTCILFSLANLYFINRISSSVYGGSQATKGAAVPARRKK
ncbi:keratinocyte-associated protein 2-like [Sycon ciliatum]|uniref:keratinocyte-associated protein 2-like n=1 Tax=Sycon ciliatum TaxID=27933 RepID=UPI0020AE1E84|eukprot:scpid80171/ scgid20595/ Protein KRTCAP2 homolog